MKIDTYQKRVRNNVSDRTLRPRMSALRKLDEFVEGEATVDDVERFLEALIDAHEDGEIKASVIHEYFKAIKSYFEVVKGDPEALDHITWLPPTDSDPGEYMNLKEWRHFFNHVKGYRDKALFQVMYQYARRPTETLLLNREDIRYREDEGKRTITFSILKKGNSDNTPTSTIWVSGWGSEGEEYEVYRTTYELTGDAEDHLDRWLDMSDPMSETIIWKDIDRDATPQVSFGQEEEVEEGEEYEVHPVFTTQHGRMTYGTAYNAVKRTAERAGFDKNIIPKTLRHSRSTHLDWSGEAPGNIARDMLIHGPDTNVIGRYIHDRGESDIREVMELDG